MAVRDTVITITGMLMIIEKKDPDPLAKEKLENVIGIDEKYSKIQMINVECEVPCLVSP